MLLLIGIAALLLAAACNGVMSVAAIRAKQDLMTVFTSKFSMPYKPLLMSVMVGGVLVGIGCIAASLLGVPR